jgi:putative lipoprotein
MSTTLRRTLTIVAVASVIVLTACSGGDSTVTGEVWKKDQKALPPNAVVTVELQDTSLADAPATTLSTDVVDPNGNQLPVQYELQYNEDDIDDRNTYTVFAKIEAGGSLLYITDTAYPVITRGNPIEDVMVEVVPTG